MAFGQDLRDIESELGRLVDSLDVSCLSPTDAASLVSVFASIEARAVFGKLSCGRRGVEGNVHLLSGERDGPTWLARQTGVSVGEARSSLAAVISMDSLPELDVASRSGSLSHSQTVEIARAGIANPSSVGTLVQSAQESSMVGLKKTCRDVLAHSAEDEVVRYEAMRSRRSFRTWTGHDGMFCGRFALLPDEGARLLSRLKPFTQSAFRSRRGSSVPKNHDNYAVDGFMGLVETSGGDRRPGRSELIVLADYDSLVRGYADSGETCEVEGLGPVPIALARSMVNDCFLSVVMNKDAKPAIAKGKGHYIPPRLRTAVMVRDKCCQVPGCDSIFRLEVDHIIPVAARGPTEIDNLVLVCKAHHDQKTYRGFRLVGQGKKRRWIPPPGPPGPAGPAAGSVTTPMRRATRQSIKPQGQQHEEALPIGEAC